jgi:hypothetical protein
MNRVKSIGFGLVLCSGLAGCVPAGGDRLIARPADGGLFGDAQGRKGLLNGEAAVAIDPDGCQNWIIDDGAEGYASRRRDPASGLPVCGGGAPGQVIGNPRVNGLPDFLL